MGSTSETALPAGSKSRSGTAPTLTSNGPSPWTNGARWTPTPPCHWHVGTTGKAKLKEKARGAYKRGKTSIVARVGSLSSATLVNPSYTC